jgi:hypothetical protein
MAHSVYAVLATFPVYSRSGEPIGTRRSRLMDFDTRNEAEQYRDWQTEEMMVEGATFEVRLLDRKVEPRQPGNDVIWMAPDFNAPEEN